MFRLPVFSRARSRRGFASALALGVALAGGSVIGTAVLETPAYAQKKPTNSKGFVAAYSPVAKIVSEANGDFAAARGQVPAVLAAIENQADRYAAGTLLVSLGTKTNDLALQRQGLDLILASGQADAERIPQYQFILGNLAYQLEDFPSAITALQAAQAGGYQDINLSGLLFESYVGQGNIPQALDYLQQQVTALQAAGTQVPEQWLLRALQVAYDYGQIGPATEMSRSLVLANPTQTNWVNALQVVYSLGDFEPTERIDLLRLMSLTNAMTDRSEYVAYIEAADPRIMSNEVLKVLQAGTASQALDPSDTYYVEVKSVADSRASVDKRELPSMVAEGRSSASGNAAHNAGEVLLSTGAYAEAEEMYALALEKGVADSNRTLTRLAIAQTMQGKHAAAKETFAKIQGKRAPIAAMWQAYIDTKA